MNKIAKQMPAADEHAPLSILNRTGRGIRTVLICSCEWHPKNASERGSTMHTAHMAHRRSQGLDRFNYANVVFGEGPYMGLTWDEWCKAEPEHLHIDPFTGERD